MLICLLRLFVVHVSWTGLKLSRFDFVRAIYVCFFSCCGIPRSFQERPADAKYWKHHNLNPFPAAPFAQVYWPAITRGSLLSYLLFLNPKFGKVHIIYIYIPVAGTMFLGKALKQHQLETLIWCFFFFLVLFALTKKDHKPPNKVSCFLSQLTWPGFQKTSKIRNPPRRPGEPPGCLAA